MKKLCEKDIHNSFVVRYGTVVGEFLNIFIRVLRGKNTWFPKKFSDGGWKWITDEISGVKEK